MDTDVVCASVPLWVLRAWAWVPIRTEWASELLLDRSNGLLVGCQGLWEWRRFNAKGNQCDQFDVD